MKRLLFKNLETPVHRPHVATTCFRTGQISLRHRHDFHEVFLVISGSGTHHINDQTAELSVGDLVVIQPDDCHHFSSAGDDGLVILNIALSANWWKSFHQLMGASIPGKWMMFGKSPGQLRLSAVGLVEMQRSFERLGGGGAGPSLDLAEALLRVISHFVSQGDSSRPPVPTWLEAWKMKMMDARDELAEPVSYWQKLSGRSPEHLSRSCRMFYQSTPTEILNDLRIDRAKALLSSTDGKVISIAYACGFGNLANFYRNFAARTGVTPQTWRRRGSATVPLQLPGSKA